MMHMAQRSPRERYALSRGSFPPRPAELSEVQEEGAQRPPLDEACKAATEQVCADIYYLHVFELLGMSGCRSMRAFAADRNT